MSRSADEARPGLVAPLPDLARPVSLYDTVDLTADPPRVNGKPLPLGVTMGDWMQLHQSSGFYHWLNAIRGCPKPPNPWRRWCGV